MRNYLKAPLLLYEDFRKICVQKKLFFNQKMVYFFSLKRIILLDEELKQIQKKGNQFKKIY